ncbi:AAA family ATPase [Lampropedia aestuarii]|uniref:AAA family ATPase n=1 Tax=Lampropedia aestuarii TaxID=2562762 RepID=A0A4S5BR53_9BURK|nr:RNA repair transcriptional activator RtcR [Lampropedia aestuarii]THJ33481.1 AAA family ATPase [Lampropedia aestuarii]
MGKKTVVIGYMGTQLDSGLGAGRWGKWRPSLSLVQHEDLLVERFELLYAPQYQALADVLQADMQRLSPQTEVRLHAVEAANPWDFGEVYASLYDWVRQYSFDTEHEDYWAHITTGTHVAQICMFLMVESRFIPGVLCQTSPPRKQREGGEAGSYTLIDLDLQRYDILAKRFDQAQHDAQLHLKSGIATRNAGFNQLIEEIEQVAVRSKAPVLLTGPTGAGKSHLAKRMYELKQLRHQVQGPFVEVNCATLRGDGAAAALFGHKKGAFTGAAAERAGLLRTAHGGVLFLDEIGELGQDEQAMLLKAIEDKRFLPMGSDKEVTSDFQLIAGTNRDLREAVVQGLFREDLFARINLWSYALPGLAARREDIGPNIDYVLERFAAEEGRVVRFHAEARAQYLDYAQSDEALWTGNFRDLMASITRLATLADGGRISTALVAAEIKRLQWLWQHALEQQSPQRAVTQNLEALLPAEQWQAMDLFDRLQLQAVLAVCRECKNLAEAGRRLFDQSRAQRSAVNDSDRLRKYLLKHGLTWERVVAQASLRLD